MSKKKQKKLKNRPKQKSTRPRPSKPSRPRSKASAPEPTDPDDSEPRAQKEEEEDEEVIASGVLTGMRGWIAGAGEQGQGLNKRRSLGEWALWVAGATAIYFAVKHFTA